MQHICNFQLEKWLFFSSSQVLFYIWLDAESLILKYGAAFSMFLILFLLLRNSRIRFRTSTCWRRVSASKSHVLKKLSPQSKYALYFIHSTFESGISNIKKLQNKIILKIKLIIIKI
jgi:hypothetical protein